MKFEAYSRSQTQALFELLAGHVAETAKNELESLKAGVDARIKALQGSLLLPDHAQLLNKLVQDLAAASRTEAEAARTEAETLAAKALLKAQEVADAALAGARAEAQIRVAEEQKASVALRTSLEEARAQLQAAQAFAQNELDRTKAELEGRLEQVQAARAELARVLAEAQRDAAAAHAELAAQAAIVKDAQSRMHVLEHETSGLVVARDEAMARAEAEAKRAQDTTDLLTASRNDAAQAKQEARLAKADAEGRRQSLEAAMQQIRTLEEAVATPGAPVQVVMAPVAAAPRGDEGLTLLEHVGTALESIDVAISASEILETLIEQFGRHFARAAVFLVGPSSFKGWRGSNVGGGGTDISNIEIPRTIDSLLTRALADRKVATVAGNAGDPAVGVLGSPASTALALPVLANGRVIAVAYAEHAEDASQGSLAVGCKIAEILIDHANRRLTVKRRGSSASSPSQETQEVDKLSGGMSLEPPAASYAPARQSRRVGMKQGLEFTLEGSASALVDMSLLGCQVLSPVAMRPKRIVRMALSSDEGVVVCRGRVVWAQIEQPAPGETESKYRAGIKFTEADPQAIETYLTRNGVGDRGRSVKEKLEETA